MVPDRLGRRRCAVPFEVAGRGAEDAAVLGQLVADEGFLRRQAEPDDQIGALGRRQPGGLGQRQVDLDPRMGGAEAGDPRHHMAQRIGPPGDHPQHPGRLAMQIRGMAQRLVQLPEQRCQPAVQVAAGLGGGGVAGGAVQQPEAQRRLQLLQGAGGGGGGQAKRPPGAGDGAALDSAEEQLQGGEAVHRFSPPASVAKRRCRNGPCG